MLKYIVYKTVNCITNQIYVGVHLIRSHKFDGYFGSNAHLKRAIKKYGRKNFIRHTLFEFDNRDDAYEIESLIVCEKFCSRRDVYNQKPGGFGGSNPNRDFHNNLQYRQKLSNGALEYNQKLKQNGEDHPNTGRKHTEETKRKMSESHAGKHTGEKNPMYGISYEDHPKGFLGKTHSEESRKQLSQSLLEYYKTHSSYERTPETREKISKSKKGRASPNKGKKMTEDQTRNMRKPKRRMTCPHCGVEGGGGNMIRYHFDNCKMKKDAKQ